MWNVLQKGNAYKQTTTTTKNKMNQTSDLVKKERERITPPK